MSPRSPAALAGHLLGCLCVLCYLWVCPSHAPGMLPEAHAVISDTSFPEGRAQPPARCRPLSHCGGTGGAWEEGPRLQDACSRATRSAPSSLLSCDSRMPGPPMGAPPAPTFPVRDLDQALPGGPGRGDLRPRDGAREAAARYGLAGRRHAARAPSAFRDSSSARCGDHGHSAVTQGIASVSPAMKQVIVLTGDPGCLGRSRDGPPTSALSANALLSPQLPGTVRQPGRTLGPLLREEVAGCAKSPDGHTCAVGGSSGPEFAAQRLTRGHRLDFSFPPCFLHTTSLQKSARATSCFLSFLF